MEFKQGFQQQMGQKLAMRLNQFQKQSLQMLQYNAQELRSQIADWQKEYPELQWEDGEPEWETGKLPLKARRHFPGEWQLEDQWESGHFLSRQQQELNSEAKQRLLENYSTEEEGEDLREVLREQLYLFPLGAEEREFAELVIQNLDERGLNRESPLLWATAFFGSGGSQRQRFARVLRQIQELEPPGCAADHPLASLRIQARLRFGEGPLLRVLQSLSSLDALSGVDGFLAYMEQCGLDASERQAALAQLRQLEPYPARGYRMASPALRMEVYPEILVGLDEGGGVYVELLNKVGTRLAIRPKGGLEPKLTGSTGRTGELEALLQQLRRREETLLQIARSIFTQQEAFVREGARSLQVLNLEMVASQLDLHPSTVSRCIQGKYCKTPWGLLPLRFFFQQGAASGQAREMVKEHIVELLGEQQGGEPGKKERGKKCSDRELMLLLSERGIQVARRTVAKYRSELEEEGRLP